MKKFLIFLTALMPVITKPIFARTLDVSDVLCCLSANRDFINMSFYLGDTTRFDHPRHDSMNFIPNKTGDDTIMTTHQRCAFCGTRQTASTPAITQNLPSEQNQPSPILSKTATHVSHTRPCQQ